jgi:hypothetical protein
VDWIHLSQDRDWQGAVVQHSNKPLGSIKCGDFLDYLSDLASQEGLCCIELDP